ncbi:hypothetical protein CSC42_6382 [Pseudomonas aeruginosa]|nr:hypothetical protein CSC42_6382 [Pseudomonas aeruginosa]
MSALSLNSIWRFVFYFLFCGDLFSKIKSWVVTAQPNLAAQLVE